MDDHADALRRSLVWDGCFNVRDLGGLETASGGRTRRGMVVRADNVRRLTAAGWQAAFDHGVRRVVDLRFENEVPGEPDAHGDFEVVVVPLRRGHNPEAARAFEQALLDADDLAPVFAAGYIRTLEDAPQSGSAARSRRSPTRRRVMASSSTASQGRIEPGSFRPCSCLSSACPDELIADDYAASDPGVEALSTPWFEAARDETELRDPAAGLDVAARDDARRARMGARQRGRRRAVPPRRPESRMPSFARCARGSSAEAGRATAAARLGAAGRDGMREVLQLVAERLEIATAAAVLERAGEEPVGELRVPR